MTRGQPPSGTASDLSVGLIRPRLAAGTVGRELYVFGEVDSTNAVLGRLAREGAPAGTVVIADAQTDARGRHGAPWFSPAGVNVYASVLFQPHCRPLEAPVFSFVASLAVGDAIEAEGLISTVKWPNDVLVDRKKVAGALAESTVRGGRLEHVILGVGVNVNVTREALRGALGPGALAAISLAEAAGREIDRSAFAAELLNRLDVWAAVFATEGPSALVAAWRGREIVGGRRVGVHGAGAPYEGRALGIDGEGHLVVQPSIGKPRRVIAGEIRLLD